MTWKKGFRLLEWLGCLIHWLPRAEVPPIQSPRLAVFWHLCPTICVPCRKAEQNQSFITDNPKPSSQHDNVPLYISMQRYHYPCLLNIFIAMDNDWRSFSETKTWDGMSQWSFYDDFTQKSKQKLTCKGYKSFTFNWQQTQHAYSWEEKKSLISSHFTQNMENTNANAILLTSCPPSLWVVWSKTFFTALSLSNSTKQNARLCSLTLS